jgi:hypothetical protein
MPAKFVPSVFAISQPRKLGDLIAVARVRPVFNQECHPG